MAVEELTEGRGISKRRAIKYSEDDFERGLTRLSQLDRSFEGQIVAPIERWAFGALREAGFDPDQTPSYNGGQGIGWEKALRERGLEDDSEPDFAVRVLRAIKWARSALKEGAKETLAGIAFDLGRLAEQARLKFGPERWEELALRGEKFKSSRRGRSLLTETLRELVELLSPDASNDSIMDALKDLAANQHPVI